MQTKICTTCDIEKEICEFHKCKGGKFGVRCDCIDCVRIKRKIYLEKNKDKTKAYSKSYYNKNKELLKIKSKNFWKKIQSNPEIAKQRRLEDKNRKLKTIFGITLNQYGQMLELQNGVCAICGKEEITIDSRSHKTQKLSVDHDHQTGKVRGLLCAKCNKMIGLSNDDNNVLISAINYLNKYNKI
ncbi:MAG: endonuclease VII domain-containing protein [Candidatus Woesearchaeota archaeon]|nr:endonuclease VII domain-containing protein [Candidatus Woesearchaeota archaeon]